MPDTPMFQNTLQYSGQNMRDMNILHVMADGTNSGARQGIRPGDPGLTVTLAGSTISVSAGIAAIKKSGIYGAVLTSAWSGTLQAANATYSRIDLVYLRVWDTDVDGSGLRQTDVVYLPGTASATPAAPTPPSPQIYIPLATITVPPTGGGSASVSTAVRPITVAPGGILPASLAPSGPYVGQYWDDGTNLYRYNGSSWDAYLKAPGAWTAYTPTWTASTTNPSVGNGTLLGYYSLMGKTCNVHIDLTWGSSTNGGSGIWFFALPFPAASGHGSRVGNAQALGVGGGERYAGQCIISPGASTTSAFFPDGAGGSQLFFAQAAPAATPDTWGSTDQLRISFTYEIA